MAGRGCLIKVEVLKTGCSSIEELSLPVAMHTPLFVLKEQLETLTNIPVTNQILILLDLTDPDRNSDVILTGRDNLFLSDCGIRNGCTISLHALGLERDETHRGHVETKSSLKLNNLQSSRVKHVLNTTVTASDANHSYNGVIFDMEARGPFEVTVTSIFLGGMLGRVRIFARNRTWEADKVLADNGHWWAFNESVSQVDWEVVADVVCLPSWDKLHEVVLDKPVVILPHSKRGFYCHSNLPDDLGIQYQSYSKDRVVGKSEHLIIHPGVGHTGCVPFDDQRGWYKAYRGLAGTVTYEAVRKGWDPWNHRLFPLALRQSVITLLMCQRHSPCIDSSHSFRTDCHMFSSAPHAPYMAASPPSQGRALESPQYASAKRQRQGWGKGSLLATGKYQQEDPEYERDSIEVSISDPSTNSRRPIPLYVLPKDVVYYMMEFMHWDWFEGVWVGGVERQIKESKLEDVSNTRLNGRSGNVLEMLLRNIAGGMHVDLGGLVAALHTGGLEEEGDDDEEEEDDDETDDDEDYVGNDDEYEEEEDNDDEIYDSDEMGGQDGQEEDCFFQYATADEVSESDDDHACDFEGDMGDMDIHTSSNLEDLD